MKLPQNFLPSDKLLQLNLETLLSDKDAEIYKKGNKLKITKHTPTASLHVEYTQYDDTTIFSTNLISHDKPVSHMQETIKQMRAEGLTQKQVAERLSTTPSNISRIEKKMRSKE